MKNSKGKRVYRVLAAEHKLNQGMKIEEREAIRKQVEVAMMLNIKREIMVAIAGRHEDKRVTKRNNS